MAIRGPPMASLGLSWGPCGSLVRACWVLFWPFPGFFAQSCGHPGRLEALLGVSWAVLGRYQKP
eukprot:1800619-Pyramimonas_sp.AAC.1